ncbi:glutathione S-transferase family protein [Hydrogenophaga sp.]|uniref:glutathione S-transferase family protein n=1 Tax=Hydrogenophaga sp. TaxID=1904254 RepID=UPI003F6F83B8
MIDFYTYPGPNSRKAQIMLEEAGAPYTVRTVDITKGEQFAPDFLRISPNNKIPAIVDHTAAGPVAVFETAAILIYLAESSGRLLPVDPAARASTLAWLIWGTSSLGGALPQLHHFVDSTDKVPSAIERFANDCVRMLKVQERRLSEVEFLAGEYSVADIPSFCSTAGWLSRVKALSNGALGDTPATHRWLKAVAERPAVRKVMAGG